MATDKIFHFNSPPLRHSSTPALRYIYVNNRAHLGLPRRSVAKEGAGRSKWAWLSRKVRNIRLCGTPLCYKYYKTRNRPQKGDPKTSQIYKN
jgi:hypothetical protein